MNLYLLNKIVYYEKNTNKYTCNFSRGGVVLTTLSSSDDALNTQVNAFEQKPPLLEMVKVQKLAAPLEGGENMLIRIKYMAEETLPTSINIYENDLVIMTLKDDGVFPDLHANDFNYATYLKQDLQKFVADIEEKENFVNAKGGTLSFTGHNGSFIAKNEFIPFNRERWNGLDEVIIYTPILDVALCGNTILKQNSLLITDLSVVEDPARTFNVYNKTGNPKGVWTFGHLMKNMANPLKTGVSTKQFLKEWVKTWVNDQYVGSAMLENRQKAFLHLICPWMIEANVASTPINLPALPLGSDISQVNLQPWIADDPTGQYPMWEVWWDQLDEENLIKFAPFKLTAIVNRLDLRGNLAYNSSIKNAGETRFVYTLINPLNGKPPMHDFPLFTSNSGAIDWQGMNVIFEYGNPQTTVCQLKEFAQQWYDLSSQPLGVNGVPNTIYNQMLQNITVKVTGLAAGGNKNKNKSALNQIRTNEKVLFPLNLGGTAFLGPEWQIPNWQLRQYDLNGNDGLLHPTYVTNTISANLPSGVLENYIYGSGLTNTDRTRIAKGNYNLPTNLLDIKADILNEFIHFNSLTPTNLPSAFYNSSNTNPNIDNPSLQYKTINQQVSLNTCQGCHGGNNKTNFTQIAPLGYGQAANYWDAIPSIQTNGLPGQLTTLDHNFINFENNNETTFDVHTMTHEDNYNEVENTSNVYNQIVSPFITGRRYSSNSSILGNNWQDDELYDAGKEENITAISSNKYYLADNQLTGLFWVNDPNNFSTSIPTSSTLLPGKGGDFPQLHTQRWGFNELERRKDDLCNFLQAPCLVGPKSIDLIKVLTGIKYIPLPANGH